MKDLIGQGYKILPGHVLGRRAPGSADRGPEPGALLSGPAASDGITGSTVHVPLRAARPPGRHAAASYLKGAGKNVSSSTQDSASARATTPRSRPCRRQGPHVSGSTSPLSATDFTPFAQQAKNAKPDVIFVAWAGTTAGAVWTALDQQDVFNGTDVVTGLAERVT